MSLATELSKLSSDAQAELASLEQQAKSLWARWEPYAIAAGAFVAGAVVGHFV